MFGRVICCQQAVSATCKTCLKNSPILCKIHFLTISNHNMNICAVCDLCRNKNSLTTHHFLILIALLFCFFFFRKYVLEYGKLAILMMIMMSQRALIPLKGYPQPEVGYALSDSRVFISSRQVKGGTTWGKAHCFCRRP